MRRIEDAPYVDDKRGNLTQFTRVCEAEDNGDMWDKIEELGHNSRECVEPKTSETIQYNKYPDIKDGTIKMLTLVLSIIIAFILLATGNFDNAIDFIIKAMICFITYTLAVRQHYREKRYDADEQKKKEDAKNTQVLFEKILVGMSKVSKNKERVPKYTSDKLSEIRDAISAYGSKTSKRITSKIKDICELYNNKKDSINDEEKLIMGLRCISYVMLLKSQIKYEYSGVYDNMKIEYNLFFRGMSENEELLKKIHNECVNELHLDRRLKYKE